jgi:hypothetical protein
LVKLPTVGGVVNGVRLVLGLGVHPEVPIREGLYLARSAVALAIRPAVELGDSRASLRDSLLDVVINIDIVGA